METFIFDGRGRRKTIIVAGINDRLIRKGEEFGFDRPEHERPRTPREVGPAYAPNKESVTRKHSLIQVKAHSSRRVPRGMKDFKS
jgi:hypothetical protein